MLISLMIILALLVLLAANDVLFRQLSDVVVVSIGIVIFSLRLPWGLVAVASSLATAFAVFVLLFIAYSRNSIGGGDVKLLTALSLGLPPIETVHFIVMTALAGGVVGLIYLGLARLRPVLRHGRDRFILRRLFIIECWRARRYRTVPYAVAIAAGAASVLLPAMLPARFVL